jgi:hypothetical protein
MRVVSSIPFAAVLLASSTAWAHHNPGYWYLEEVVLGELDAYEGSVGNTVNYINVDPVTGAGEMELSACCNPDDCAGSGSNIYLLTWEIVPSAANASRGQTFEVHLTNDLIDGIGCADIDPFISTCGQEGAPASQETEQNIVLDYRSNSLTHAECNRFYPDPEYYATSHVPSPHEVYFYDHDNMPHDGYWWLNITHRWGMQYEVVYVYREDVALTGGPPMGGAGGSAGSPQAGSGGMDPGAGGTGPVDLGDAGIDPELGGSSNGGSANGTGGKPPGSSSDPDGGNTLNPNDTDNDAGARRGGGGGGGCGISTSDSRPSIAWVALLMALASRRRRAR